jgi:hypothetical protein
VVLWRGYFQGNNVTALRLAINGGEGDWITALSAPANAVRSFCGKYILQRALHPDNIRKVSMRTPVQLVLPW